MRRKRWFVDVCYVLPGSAAETYHITKVLYQCQDGLELILVGDLNINLSQPEGIYIYKDLVVMLVVEEME